MTNPESIAISHLTSDSAPPNESVLTTNRSMPSYEVASLPAHIKRSPKRILQLQQYAWTDEIMAALWQTLGDFYGTKWGEAFGSFFDAKGQISHTVVTWSEALYEVTPERLRRGLNACLERDSPWPPTLPEFMKLCERKPWE